MWAAGYGSTVRAVRCADLVLPLRPKDDPTDKFDDAVEFVRQFVTFLEVASSARAPWARGESSRSLLLCLPRSATSKQSVSLMEFGYKGKKEDIFCAGDQQRIIP